MQIVALSKNDKVGGGEGLLGVTGGAHCVRLLGVTGER